MRLKFPYLGELDDMVAEHVFPVGIIKAAPYGIPYVRLDGEETNRCGELKFKFGKC
jgi:hypothetical protein